MKKNITLLELDGNSNIGLFLVVCDSFAICGIELDSKKKEKLEKIFCVPIYFLKCFGCDLCGIFIATNSKFILAPNLFTNEIESLKKIAKKHKKKLLINSNNCNTFGNSCFLSDKFALISNMYGKKFAKDLEKDLEIDVTLLNAKNFECVGALFCEINKKILVSQEIDEATFKKIKKYVSGVSSVNLGSAYISSGVVGNKFGLAIGAQSSTIEIQNLTEGFDFLKK